MDGAFFSLQEFLNHDTAACVTKKPLVHDLMNREGSLPLALADQDTFSERESVGFDDHRRLDSLSVLLCIRRIFEARGACARNAVANHEILGENFRRLESGRTLCRAEN